jgi:hypothetical protein
VEVVATIRLVPFQGAEDGCSRPDFTSKCSPAMEDHMFEQFIKERQYLQNVSPRTIQWYQESFKWLDNPNPNKAELKQFVIRLREKGLKASNCNNRIRAVNA